MTGSLMVTIRRRTLRTPTWRVPTVERRMTRRMTVRVWPTERRTVRPPCVTVVLALRLVVRVAAGAEAAAAVVVPLKARGWAPACSRGMATRGNVATGSVSAGNATFSVTGVSAAWMAAPIAPEYGTASARRAAMPSQKRCRRVPSPPLPKDSVGAARPPAADAANAGVSDRGNARKKVNMGRGARSTTGDPQGPMALAPPRDPTAPRIFAAEVNCQEPFQDFCFCHSSWG